MVFREGFKKSGKFHFRGDGGGSTGFIFSRVAVVIAGVVAKSGI